MRKILLSSIAAAILGITSAYAGPINDQVVEIGPGAVAGLRVLGTPSGDFPTAFLYSSTVTKPPKLGETKDKALYKSVIRIVTTYEKTGFKIIGNHAATTSFGSGTNDNVGMVSAKIGKDEDNYCTIDISYGKSAVATITEDCSHATDFTFASFAAEKLQSAYDSTATYNYHLYFQNKAGATQEPVAANDPAKTVTSSVSRNQPTTTAPSTTPSPSTTVPPITSPGPSSSPVINQTPPVTGANQRNSTTTSYERNSATTNHETTPA